MSARSVFERLLVPAQITINGAAPWDIRVHNTALYDRVLRGGSMALGESYMDGWWDVERLDEFFCRILAARIDRNVRFAPSSMLAILRAHFRITPQQSFIVGQEHYDRGNDLYAAMLGPTMAYTCGYWQLATTLEEAQVAKLDLVCRKLKLRPGMSVLDIGSGWGSFAHYAAEQYGVSVTGVTISVEQVEFARQWCRGLPIEFKLCDYRHATGQYDRVVSLGMFEHVGRRQYRTFMDVVDRRLAPDGLFLLHTIGGAAGNEPDPWVEKYIFPNGVIPSLEQIHRASEPGWIFEDGHNFGADYDPTLMAWRQNFIQAWPQLAAKYGQRFYRMWEYWLCASAGSFRARHSQLWQLVFSRGIRGGYRSVR